MKLTFEQSAALLHKFWSGQSVPSPKTGRPMRAFFVDRSFNPAKYNIRSATNQYFDTTPFSIEPLGTFGNTVRNFMYGPGFDYTNLQLSKNVHFSSDGKRYVQLRLEAFNAFRSEEHTSELQSLRHLVCRL